MFTVTAYASGSSGNCYTLQNKEATLMLDCGLSLGEIQRLAGYELPDAVFVTHEHNDHGKAAKEFLRRGVDVCMTQGTAEKLGVTSLDGSNIHIMEPGATTYYVRDDIRVVAFPTQHDAEQPCGFFIEGDGEKVIYATDTYYIKYKFNGLTKIIVEANHSYDILRENVASGRLDHRLAKRLTKSHFSIENVLTFLKANDLSNVNEIWLVHLSDNNADPDLFRKMAAEETGKPVYVAGKRGVTGGEQWRTRW